MFCQYILVFLELLLLFYSFGHLLFDKLILKEVPFETWTLFILSIFSVTFFNTSYVFSLFKERMTFDQKDYSECEFPTDYDRQNPMSQRQAYRQWLIDQQIIEATSQEEDENGLISTLINNLELKRLSVD